MNLYLTVREISLDTNGAAKLDTMAPRIFVVKTGSGNIGAGVLEKTRTYDS